jgi:plasminogen activator inhibitor 1 RNA-binding protein
MRNGNVGLMNLDREVEDVVLVEVVVVASTIDILRLEECTVSIVVTDCSDTQKASDQAWGPETTSWESAAPIAEADRNEEKKDSVETDKAAEEIAALPEETPAKEPEKEPEEEDNTQTYVEYLASKVSNAFSIGEARKPDQSEWEGKTAILKKARGVQEALFGEKATEKSKTSASKKTSAPKKVILEIEQRFTPVRSGRGGERGGRGGRGGDRERGTGERGGRGRGDGTPRGRGRGEDRGRGRATSGRGRGNVKVDVTDTNAFPALG